MSARPPGIRLRVSVDRAPEPSLLRAAIAARLGGRPVTGPEGTVASAVASAVSARLTSVGHVAPPPGRSRWR